MEHHHFPRSSERAHGRMHLAIAASLCLALGSSPALAEVSRQAKAAAESLFDDGLALMKEGKNEQACSKLEQSQQIDPGVGTLLYLGECYARTDRAASAWATFREAASLARASGQTERAERAQRRAAELQQGLSYLTISVAEEVRELPGLSIERAGETVGTEVLGVELPVDPGVIVVEVRARGHEPYRAEVQVPKRGRERVTIPRLEPVPEEAVPAPESSAAMTPQTPSRPVGTDARSDTSPGGAAADTQRILGLSLAGVGVIGIGVGTYFGFKAISNNSDAEAGSCDEKVCQLRSDLEKVNDARSQATVSTMAFAGGAAALGAGLLLYWLAPDAAETAWRIHPDVDAQGLRVTLGGSL